MFDKKILQGDYGNLYENLFSATAIKESFSKNHRQGAVIVDPYPGEDGDFLTPIVRTTAVYGIPSQNFAPIHHALIKDVRYTFGMPGVHFNNGMIEIYDDYYNKMNFYSDGALDLVQGSHICIVSCYENKDETNPRILTIQDKTTKECKDITLEQGSAIIFNTFTNSLFLHKITLSGQSSKWLGLTLRFSKTLVEKREDKLIDQDGNEITLATEDERKEFYKCKKQENETVNYSYPDINYTLSKH